MKSFPFVNFWASFIIFFSKCTHMLTFISAFAYTIITILQIIVNTTNQSLWVQIINITEAFIIGRIIIDILELALVKLLPKFSLLESISIYLSGDENKGISLTSKGWLLGLLFFFDSYYVQNKIWHCDGHGLYGTWIFYAGNVPFIIIILAAISLSLQGQVREAILKKYKNKSSHQRYIDI